jgi:hypothetical protein
MENFRAVSSYLVNGVVVAAFTHWGFARKEANPMEVAATDVSTNTSRRDTDNPSWLLVGTWREYAAEDRQPTMRARTMRYLLDNIMLLLDEVAGLGSFKRSLAVFVSVIDDVRDHLSCFI